MTEAWKTCSKHGPDNPSVWGCPECVRELRDENRKLKRGNTRLIEALMDMVNQFFFEEDGVLSHSHMSAEEGSIEVLMAAGFAEEVDRGSYRLRWDKLKERQDNEPL